MSDENATYKVVFWGEVLLGQSRQQVADRFAQCFKLKDKKVLSRLFSGRLTILKKGISEVEARQYCEAIRSLGAVCRLERECVILTPRPVHSTGRDTLLEERSSAVRATDLRLVGEDEDEPERERRNPFAARDISSGRFYDKLSSTQRYDGRSRP